MDKNQTSKKVVRPRVAGTIRMKFSEDKTYNGELIFEKNKCYDVETKNGWAARWLKRGGIETEGEEIQVPDLKKGDDKKSEEQNKGNENKSETKK